MQRSIQHKWFFNHPREIVWEYLIKPDLIALWIMEKDFQPVVGQKFMFHAKANREVDFDGEIYCEVLEIIPLKRLSYSWKCGPGKEKLYLIQ